jgi:putative ABC transport system ATP-binding protein
LAGDGQKVSAPAGLADSDEATARGGVPVVIEKVVKSYGGLVALHGISFDVGAGEFLAIRGPSGAGKSTLLNLLGALDRPDSGIILVDGNPVPSPRGAVEFRRRVVGFVFQDHLLLPYLSAQSNVETALVATGVDRQDRRRRSQELLAEVGLGGRLGHLPSELSAGERQRVAVARALANAPRLLLADEPTGALDSAVGARVLELVARMRERHGMTVIIASHDPSVSARADRVVELVDGRLR